MAYDLGAIEPDAIKDITQDEYYKKIKRQLREKSQSHQLDHKKNQDQSTDDVSDVNQTKRVTDVASVNKSSDIQKLLHTTDKVEIRSYTWGSNEDNEPEIQSDPKPALHTSVDMKNDGLKILKVLGLKIDFESRITHLQDTFMQHVVQSRSSNMFLSRFAQFKVGVLGQLLGFLGMTTEEIQTLKTEALQGAKRENIRMMKENMYNMELAQLVHGQSRKVRRSLKALKEMETQLAQQMTLLGWPDHWTKVSILEGYEEQCLVIKREFENELNELNYLIRFMGQDAVLSEKEEGKPKRVQASKSQQSPALKALSEVSIGDITSMVADRREVSDES